MAAQNDTVYFDNLFFELSQDLCVVSNFDAYFLELNSRWTEVLGFSQDELKSKPFLEFLHPVDYEKTVKEASNLFNHQPHTVKFTNRYLSRSGKEVWLQWNSTVDYEKQLVFSVARVVTEEVTARLEKERITKMLQKSESMYRNVLENTSDAIVMWGLDSAIYISPTVETIFGYSPEEFKLLDHYSRVPKEDHHRLDYIDIQFQSGEEEVVCEHRFKRKDGKEIWVNSRVRIIKDAIGEREAVITTSNDVTQRVLATQQLMEALEVKDSLFRELHHRIKNNLNIISSFLYLKSTTTRNPELLSFIKETKNRIESISKTHEQLLKLEEVNQLGTKAYFHDLIETMLSSYVLDQLKVEFQSDIADLVLPVDQIFILGLLLNEMLSNSVKYAFEPGQPGKIDFSISKEDNQLIYQYGDNGKGLPASYSETTSIGLKLIELLAKQLKGEMEIIGTEGLKYKIVFPYEVK